MTNTLNVKMSIEEAAYLRMILNAHLVNNESKMSEYDTKLAIACKDVLTVPLLRATK